MFEPERERERVEIRLGDIIEIDAPADAGVHGRQVMVVYADPGMLKVVAPGNDEEIDVPLAQDGSFRNEAIVGIDLLSRAEHPGYAKQNDLTPGAWVDVYFGGDVPEVVTGKVTNLEEDMIELSIVGEDDPIYIDFAYKGLPEDLPIERIAHRPPPRSVQDGQVQEGQVQEGQVQEGQVQEGQVQEGQAAETEQGIEFDAPPPDAPERIREVLIEADQIQIGPQLEEITQEVAVPESQQRFGIDKQTNDMLDEMLSSVPTQDRTAGVLNAIHTEIERYKQLRAEFSVFDSRGNALMPARQGAEYKPLVKSLLSLNQKLYWLLPVARETRKLYDVDTDEMDEGEDVDALTLAAVRVAEDAIISNYDENTIPDGDNGYMYMVRSLRPYLTPFSLPARPDLCVTSAHIAAPMCAVVDNLGDFQTSVAKGSSIAKRRFYLQNYTMGENTLEAQRLPSGDVSVRTKAITPPDVMSVTSLLFLPESTYVFSRINLPGTSIMQRADLGRSFIRYWEFLNRLTTPSTQIVDPRAEKLTYDGQTFMKGILECAPDPGFLEDQSSDRYQPFLEAVIPRTRILFDLIKPYLTGRLSVYEAIAAMEPFMVYPRDVAFMQYEEITRYVAEKIGEYKKTYARRSRDMAALRRQARTHHSPRILALLDGRPGAREVVEGAYGLRESRVADMSDGELLSIANSIDCGRLLVAALALASADLAVSGGAERLQALDAWAKETNSRPDDSHCPSLVLAKAYVAMDELEADNDVETFFDKRYDKTFYDLLDEYQPAVDAEVARQPLDGPRSEMEIRALAPMLATAVGLSPEAALRDARAMVRGRRAVEDGDYAVLTDPDPQVPDRYYRRQDMTWVLDPETSDRAFGTDERLFCNLSESCFAVSDECLGLEAARARVQAADAEQVVAEFDRAVVESSSEALASAEVSFELASLRARSLRFITSARAFQYDRQRAVIGSGDAPSALPQSPVEGLRDLILAQGDLVKRQGDIVRFVARYTRTANPDEDEHWLYCSETETKLLPVFVAKLATVFVEHGDYLAALGAVCRRQGTLSDDGDAWVDKYSGYTITNVGWDDEQETFGPAAVGRDVLELDLGESIMTAEAPLPKFQTPEAARIAAITKAMGGFLGVDLSPSVEFVVRGTLASLAKAMPAREAYERAVSAAAKQGKKKLDSYETAFNASLVIITLCYVLLAVQTSIPSLATRKNHPGCKRGSLFQGTGYPLSGKEDKSGLVYIACVANKIKSSVSPWNAISRISESGIAKKMESTIEKILLRTEEVKTRIREKQVYLTQVAVGAVPVEHDMRTWSGFMPPLMSIKARAPVDVSPEFLDSIPRNLARASPKQFEQIDVMRSKIIFHSLAIQVAIQKVVTKESAILSNSVGEPFLENACCDDGTPNAYEYFAQKEGAISSSNDAIRRLTNVLDDLGAMARAATLFDPADTKFRYPDLSAGFSEETICRAFIVYCKYGSHLPVAEPLGGLCMSKPDNFDINESIGVKLEKLKAEGRVFSTEALDGLMAVVNARNIVSLSLHRAVPSERLRLLAALGSELGATVPLDFQALLGPALEADPDSGEPARALRNYLDNASTRNEQALRDFVTANAAPKKARAFDGALRSLSELRLADSASRDPRYENFARRAVREIGIVLPTIAIHGVDYTNISVPRHWKLSDRHVADIREIVRRHYAPLIEFYGDEAVGRLAERVREESRGLAQLAELTYGAEGSSLLDPRTSRLLLRFYLSEAMMSYVRSVDDVRTRSPGPLSGDEPFGDTLTTVQVAEAYTGVAPQLEMIAGERLVMEEKAAMLLTAVVGMVGGTKGDLGAIDYTYDQLQERILRSKEREKDVITSYLKEMTDEEREVENLFKNHKLGMWGVGQQKGFRVYQGDTYDGEREALEKQALSDLRLGRNHLVTEMNRDIFAMEAIAEQAEADRIEREEADLGMYVGEDDDYGERDGDEGY
jgi:hypothetical protein